ncbi:hypothetical protein G6F22_019440 [Rhizopus arrhizus]|nr:hypothetical protein G6F22_019440 [Rhizopus arrhizus]
MSGNGTVPNSSDMTAVPAAGPASCNSPPTYPVTSADAELPRKGTVRSFRRDRAAPARYAHRSTPPACAPGRHIRQGWTADSGATPPGRFLRRTGHRDGYAAPPSRQPRRPAAPPLPRSAQGPADFSWTAATPRAAASRVSPHTRH